MGLKGSRTEKNLLAAFAGESQARNRYTFYAGVASKEGFEGIAGIFLETADNEKKHAHLYFKQLGGSDVEITAGYPTKIGDTATNLAAAAAGEHEEWTTIYPTFGKIAEEEGFSAAAHIFRMIAGVEVHHEKRFQGLLKRVQDGTLFKREKPIRWKCLVCGHIHEGTKAPVGCPVCAHPQGWFVPAEENF
ncbi:MAG: rubrerythrin [Deltaproteobacteria bacterium RBG_16_64_85]|nr:MAG: rubrerythrin [Deltaproteobacteria bacterium RBG_16_64_85]